jgi:hypothetical protein
VKAYYLSWENHRIRVNTFLYHPVVIQVIILMLGGFFIIAVHLLLKFAAIFLISPEQEDYQHDQPNPQKCQYDPVWLQFITFKKRCMVNEAASAKERRLFYSNKMQSIFKKSLLFNMAFHSYYNDYQYCFIGFPWEPIPLHLVILLLPQNNE